MSTTELLAALALVACSSPSSPPPAMPSATTTCSDLACLDGNEGKVIDVDGTYAFPPDPKRKGQHLHRLTLADSTSLVLHAKHAKLTRDLDGKRITVRGVYYKHPTPERYGIIESVADPYLVELYDVLR